MKTFGIAVAVVVVVVLSAVLMSVTRLGCNAHEQAQRVVEKTIDADNVIYNYEWFHQTYEDVQALDRKIEQAKSSLSRFVKEAGPRSDWTFDERQEHDRLNAVLQGLENQRADVVATYNARSKMANRELFKDGRLPDNLQ